VRLEEYERGRRPLEARLERYRTALAKGPKKRSKRRTKPTMGEQAKPRRVK